MTSFDTLLYEEADGVATITLNRPEALNAFNTAMQRELRRLWTDLRENGGVRCVVLTGQGEKAFCTGIDRNEMISGFDDPAVDREVGYKSPWMFDDPGKNICPKTLDMWKPVIAAVNGMACGGAFYMLGEVDFIIAAEHATFFDPHVTYGMTAAFEPIHMLQKMPFHEIMRLSLLGNNERMSAKRAYEVGLVSEVVPYERLGEAASWAARAIADQPELATGGTVRALWMALELSRRQALDHAFMFTHIGTDRENILEGQQRFSSGQRVKPRIR